MNYSNDKIYKGKIDFFLGVFLILTLVFLLAILGFVLYDMHINDDEDFIIALVISIVTFVFSFIMIVPMFFRNTVTIKDNIIIVRFGIFTKKIAISNIEGINKTRSCLASYSLSLDQVEILHKKGKKVIIATKDNDDFIYEVESIILKNKTIDLDY